MVVKQKLGHKLARLRVEAELTQSEVADVLEISVRSVQRFEAGNDLPKYITLFKFAKLFKVHPGDLLDDSWRSWRRRPE